MESFDDWLNSTDILPVCRHKETLKKLNMCRETFLRPPADIVEDLMCEDIPRLAARDIVHTASMFFEEQRRRAKQPLAIFWDVENVQIPTSISGKDAANALKSKLSAFGYLMSFRAYLSVEEGTLPPEKRSEMQLSGCHLIDTPHLRRKEVADKMILVDAMAFAAKHPDGARICFVTGDKDYSYMFSVLRTDTNCGSVLVHPGRMQSVLHMQADSCLRWETDVLGDCFPRPSVSRGEAREGASSPTAASSVLTATEVQEDDCTLLRYIMEELRNEGHPKPLKSLVGIKLKEANPVFSSADKRRALLNHAIRSEDRFLQQEGEGGSITLSLIDDHTAYTADLQETKDNQQMGAHSGVRECLSQYNHKAKFAFA
eukprot:gb/GECG01007865.1/.p1 GENE.gb/GECG01007865.1/~~gb/GECG01007865.1/.p1  ORF type:complete len:372 (+),score=58.00 gb/GECG01007865.1/:1-1116(+)